MNEFINSQQLSNRSNNNIRSSDFKREIKHYPSSPESYYHQEILVKNQETSLYPNLIPKLRSIDIGEPRLTNGQYFKLWREKSTQSPDDEFLTNIDFIPVHLTSFRNFLFCMNESSHVLLFSVNTDKKIEFKNTFKISVPNVRGIAANFEYFAVSYSQCKSSQLKGPMKHMKPNGVLLFRRDDINSISSSIEKSIDIDGGFKSPVGFSMNNEYLFVCDKDLRCVFKINIKNSKVMNKISLSDGEPSYCSINQSYLVVSDVLRHRLIVYDVESFVELNKIIIEQQDGANGPFTVQLTDDNSIFYKNYLDYQLVLTDVDFNQQVSFKNLKSGILGICVLQCGVHHTLVVASIAYRNQFKFLTFSI